VEVAEHIRRLPLSFFNNRDLADLTTTIMADCTAIEHVMSHVAPGLFGGIITDVVICALLAFYDWRMALALIMGSRKLQSILGERQVATKLAVSGQTQEYLEGIKVIKAFGLAGEKSEALRDTLRHMMKEAIAFEGDSFNLYNGGDDGIASEDRTRGLRRCFLCNRRQSRYRSVSYLYRDRRENLRALDRRLYHAAGVFLFSYFRSTSGEGETGSGYGWRRASRS
jgi:ABC-type multidrug transport system fused ATPase/permease subunit